MTSIAPRIKGIGIIALVPDDWSPPWTVRHQVLWRLARYFNTVWINPALPWREAWFGASIGPSVIEYDDAPGLMVYRPGKWVPKVYRPRFVAELTERLRLQRARALLERVGSERVILYIWRPEFDVAMDLLDHDLVCYHIDDEYSFSEVDQPNNERELKLLCRADQVVIHSLALMEKKGRINPHTMRVPNGVDYAAYSTPTSEPADMAPIPRPRLGYVGMIKKQIDFDLLCELAERRRKWSIVLVGPVGVLGREADAYQRLYSMSNVYSLGSKPPGSLPAYTQHFDVCMLCYRMDDYTKYIYPAKLHEYLATGRPVVGVPIHSLHEFRDVITLATTSEEWCQAIEQALVIDLMDDSSRRRRQAIAAEHNWDRLVNRIATTLCERLGDDCYKDLTAVTQPG